MTRSRIAGACLLALSLSFTVPVTEATAQTDTLTVVTSPEGGGLAAAVEATGAELSEVAGLTVTGGMLNLADAGFINEQLTALTDLSLVDTADFLDSAVPSSAFSGNTSLQRVTLENTHAIGDRAFYDVTTLVGADLPEVRTLGGLVFSSNVALDTVYLPNLTAMGNRAFYNTISLSSLTLGATPPALLGQGGWFLYATGVTIYVPVEEAIPAYREHEYFQQFKIRLIGDVDPDPEDPPEPNTPEICGDHCGRIGGADSVRVRGTEYYAGDYKLSMNLHSFNLNINAWLYDREGTPPLDTLSAIRFADQAGFDAVDVLAYYIPGYSNTTMPTKPDAEIKAFAAQIRSLTDELGLEISGTGMQSNFASPLESRRELDVERAKYWIDVAAVMGAPVLRMFSGPVPADIRDLGWENVARQRVVPALREVAEYAADKGVTIGVQNHGDMTATAAQTIQLLAWVDHPNIGIVNDTGYFRPFRYTTGLNYDWYADMLEALPHSVGYLLKRKPAGAETDIPMDMDKAFTDLRYSDYRGYVAMELLWVRGDPGYPRDLTEPPYDQVADFLGQVRTAMDQTKRRGPVSGFGPVAYAFGTVIGMVHTHGAAQPAVDVRVSDPDGDEVAVLRAHRIGGDRRGKQYYLFAGHVGRHPAVTLLGPIGPSITEQIQLEVGAR
jgi:sugar phosphate isomerase/epimerase